jgi:hypothetical protein
MVPWYKARRVRVTPPIVPLMTIAGSTGNIVLNFQRAIHWVRWPIQKHVHVALLRANRDNIATMEPAKTYPCVYQA